MFERLNRWHTRRVFRQVMGKDFPMIQDETGAIRTVLVRFK